jgi:hypothetical protein
LFRGCCGVRRATVLMEPATEFDSRCSTMPVEVSGSRLTGYLDAALLHT